jgi:uncharacterized MAPEG superfamily protein
MTRELFWLTLTIAMTVLFWIPYILDRAAVRGLMGAMDNPDPRATPQSAWAVRMQAAHYNAVENLVTFAPLVLILRELNISTAATGIACMIYFWTRLGHYLIYTAGIPVARTLIWAISWLMQVVLILAIFRIV